MHTQYGYKDRCVQVWMHFEPRPYVVLVGMRVVLDDKGKVKRFRTLEAAERYKLPKTVDEQ